MNSKWISSIIYLILLVSNTLFSNVFAFQTPILDSLWHKFECESKEISKLTYRIEIEECLAELPVPERQGEGLRLFDQAMDIEVIERDANQNAHLLSKAHEYEGIKYLYIAQYDSATIHMKKAVEYRIVPSEKWMPNRWLGLINDMQGNLAEATRQYQATIQSSEEYFRQTKQNGAKYLTAFYGATIPSYINLGDVRSAIKSANQSSFYASQLDDDYTKYMAVMAYVRANVHTGNPDSLIHILESSVFPFLKQNNQNQSEYHFLHAYINYHAENYQEAVNGFKLSIENEAFESDSFSSLQLLGGCYYHQQKYKQALQCFEEVNQFFRENAPNSFSLAHSHSNMALTYLELGEIELARKNILKAIELPTEMVQTKITYRTILSQVVWEEFKQSKNPTYIDSIFQNITTSNKLILSLREERKAYEDYSDFNESIFKTYQDHLEILSEIYDMDPSLVNQEILFKYLTDLKSNSLREQLKTDGAVIIGNMPDSILTKEKIFIYTLNKLEENILSHSHVFKEDSVLNSLKIQLDKEKDNYYDFLAKMELEYPNYYRYQYTQDSISLTDIQHDLERHEALLVYFVADDVCFAQLIAKEQATFFSIDLDDNWEETIDDYISKVSDPEVSMNDYQQSSSQIYQMFLDTIVSGLSDSIRNIKILADDKLSLIPFEVLCYEQSDDANSYKDLSYLMKKFIISYAPSTSYAISQTYLKPRKTKYSYAGFAPEYNSITSSGDMYSHLQDLPFARESVASIAKLLDGQSYISSRATVGGFKAEAPKANIIHLAMHGLIDPETPLLSKLIFGGNKTQNVLSTSDLLDINFNAKLAVLSACNTGVGKIVNGDGIQNIARSFAFAGIENIIMSLWSIPDVQTAALEKKFFDGIMLKQNVDLALHNAKLDYLTECTELRASPFYWAGFIASGEMSAIELPADGIPFTVILLCSLVFLAVIYGFMSGSKKTNSTNMN